MGADAEKIGLLKKGMYGTRDAARNWERGCQELKSWGYQLGLSSNNHKVHRVSGMAHGDEFVLTEPMDRLTELNKMTGVYPIKPKFVSYGSTESIKALSKRLHW